jgi:hypothetical protein
MPKKDLQLKYQEKSSASSFTSEPQNTINVPRLVQGKPDYWEKIGSTSNPRKKTLILADWTARYWSNLTIANIQFELNELLNEGFTIYAWQNGVLEPLTDVNQLLVLSFRMNITPVLPETLLEIGLQQHKLTRDKTFVLDDYQLQLLHGKDPSEPRAISSEVFVDSHHKDSIQSTLIRTASPPITTISYPVIDVVRFKGHYTMHIGHAVEVQWGVIKEISELDGPSIRKIGRALQYETIVASDAEEILIIFQDGADVTNIMTQLQASDWSKVKVLTLSGSENIDISLTTLEKLLSKMPNLTCLTLERLTISFDDTPLSLNQLRMLSVNNTRISTKAYLSLLNHTRCLSSLEFRRNHRINDVFLGHDRLKDDLRLNYLSFDSESDDDFRPFYLLIHHMFAKQLEIKSPWLNVNQAPNDKLVHYETCLNDNRDLESSIMNLLYIHNDTTKLEIGLRDLCVKEDQKQIVMRYLDSKSSGDFDNLQQLGFYRGALAWDMLKAWMKKAKNCEELHLSTITFLPVVREEHDIIFFSQVRKIYLVQCELNRDFLFNLILCSRKLEEIKLDYCSTLGIDQELLKLIKHRNIRIIADSVEYNFEQTIEKNNTARSSKLTNLFKKVGHYLPKITPSLTPPAPSSKPQPTVRDETTMVDADTALNEDPEHLTRIFQSTSFWHQHPLPNYHRLSIYDTLTIIDKPKNFKEIVKLENSHDIHLTEPLVQPIEKKEDIRKLSAKIKQPCFYGLQTFTLNTNHWQPIASLSVNERLLYYRVTPATKVEIRYSNRDNLYYMRSLEGEKTITFDFLLQELPRAKIQLNSEIQHIVNQFKKYKSGALILKNKNPTGEDYLNALIEQKVGACRHRAIAFKYYMEKHFPSVPVRITSNDCHMFVEIKQGNDWISCDLGGYRSQLIMHEIATPASEETPADVEKSTAEAEKSIAPSSAAIAPLSEKSPTITVSEIEYRDNEQQWYECQFEPWLFQSPPAPTLRSYYQGLLSGLNKNQLVQMDRENIQSFNLALQTYAKNTHHPVFYINHPDELLTSIPYVHHTQDNHGELRQDLKQGGGALYDFLTKNPDKNSNAPIIIVNYNHFSADDIVRFNALLDKARKADVTPIPENTLIVGLIDPKAPNSYTGADFYSRFHQIQKFACNEALPPLKPLPTRPEERMTPQVSINLCHSPAWEVQLLGGWILKDGKLQFEPGELLIALGWTEKDGQWQFDAQKHAEILASDGSIEILNPPSDEAFALFWENVRLHEAIEINGQKIAFPKKLSIYQKEGYAWKEALENVTWMKDAEPSSEILNAETLHQFIAHYDLNAQQQLTKLAGKLKHYDNKTLSILVTNHLSEDEWGLFFKEAQKYPNLKLSIACAPGVSLPSAFDYPFSSPPSVTAPWQGKLDGHLICIQSDDCDLILADIYKNNSSDANNTITIDASECHLSDLVEHLNVRIENLEFKCTREQKLLITALEAGKTVILTGSFSEELLNSLAPFLYQRSHNLAAKGKLILINDKPLPFLTHFQQHVSVAKKTAFLQQQFSKQVINRLLKEDPECLKNEPYVRLVARLKYLQYHAKDSSLQTWSGLDAVAQPIQLPSFNPKTSAAETAQFINHRIQSVQTVLQHSPFVFLAGLTGVGKSRFVERELANPPFNGEKKENLIAWATSRGNDDLILFMDEANLSPQQWSQFEGLFHQPPSILIDGHYYPLTEKHKVIFAGNPLSYGDERETASFFRRHGSTLIFTPLPPAFIYEKTIKPVLSDECSDSLVEIVGKELLQPYQFLIECSKTEVLITPRQIQMMALLVRSFYHSHPQATEQEIREISRFYAQQIALPLVPPQFLEAFEKRFSRLKRPRVLVEEKRATTHEYLQLPSRENAHLQIIEFLHLREAAKTNLDKPAICYGGLNRLVVEGAPGIGKSEMMIELLLSQGLTKGNFETDYLAQEDSNIFYHMPATLSYADKKRLLLKAFDEGAVVLIDEINSIAMMEKLLNSLLDGVHPEEHFRQPHRPGFRLMGTQNPATMAGRTIESPALANRTQAIIVGPYTTAEMVQIVMHMGLDERRSHLLVRAFETKIAEAKANNYSPIPTFRHLMTSASNLIEASKRAHSPLSIVEINADLSPTVAFEWEQLGAYGIIGECLKKEMDLLQQGCHSAWPIWQDSAVKLATILEALTALNPVNEEILLHAINTKNSALSQALNAYSKCTGDKEQLLAITEAASSQLRLTM